MDRESLGRKIFSTGRHCESILEVIIGGGLPIDGGYNHGQMEFFLEIGVDPPSSSISR